MRKIIIIILLFVTIGVKGQCNLPYKPFKDFQGNPELINDTLAYLEYNFDERAICYVGKTVGDLLKALEFSVKAFSPYTMGDHLSGVELYLSDLDYTKKESMSAMVSQGVMIYFEDFQIRFPIYKELVSRYPKNKWVTEHYELVKDLKIQGVSSNYLLGGRLKYLWERENEKNNREFELPSNEEWLKTIEAGSKELKEELEKSSNTTLRSATSGQLKKKEIKNIELIPVEIFTMHYEKFEGLNIYDYIEEFLQPKTSEAVYYATKDNRIIASADPVYVGGKWQTANFEAPNEKIAATLSDIYFNRQLPVYIIEVQTDPERGNYKKFLVYIENNYFRMINDDGTTNYFADEMVTYRKKLKSTAK